MSATDRNRNAYLGVSAIDARNDATLYKPGELGTEIPDVVSDRIFKIVQVDSGCTASTGTGIVAAAQLAFWKDKTNSLVTNDATQANAVNAPTNGWGNGGAITLDARNFVAGVFTTAVTAGYYTNLLRRSNQGAGYAVKAAVGGTYNAGVMLVANTGTAADATSVAAGTAPTAKTIGVVLANRNGSGNVPCWVNVHEED